jgi:hypothetical protein
MKKFDDMATLRPVGKCGSFEVLWTSQEYLVGHFIMDDAGFYMWWPLVYAANAWAPYALRAIADKLDDMNAAWNEQVREEMEAMRERRSNSC